jgi:hypothetical protein
MLVIDKRMYLLNDKIFKDKILKEAHEFKFVDHPSNANMYKNLNFFYWWSNIKKEIAIIYG